MNLGLRREIEVDVDYNRSARKGELTEFAVSVIDELATGSSPWRQTSSVSSLA
jgi:hypothetical protein